MRHPANPILEQRAQRPRTLWAIVFSVAAHGALVVGAVLVPILAAHARPPIEFHAVSIVPVQALGVPEPAPRPEPAKESRPEPPKPAPPEPPKPAPTPSPSPTATTKPEKRAQPAPPEPAAPRQRQGSPLGSDIASSPFGAAGVGLDNPDFIYGYYVDQIVSMISAAWVRPRVVGRIEAIVYFRIARDGTVSQLKLVTSSGNRAFDDAALRAVSAAAPLPPLPASFSADSIGVRLAVR